MDGATRDTQTRYVFVDAGHILSHGPSRLAKLYSEPRDIDYSLVRSALNANRVYVFDALPTVKTPSQSDADHAAALTNASLRLRGIEHSPYVHVRTGTMVGDGRKRRQKGVDIALAVEALTHAFRRNMEHAILVTGDADFTPLVRALVDAGTYVTLIGHDPPADLIGAADVYEPLGLVRLTEFAYSERERDENKRLVRVGYPDPAFVAEGFGTCAVATLELRMYFEEWIVTPGDGDWGFVSSDARVAADTAQDALGANVITWDAAAQAILAMPSDDH